MKTLLCFFLVVTSSAFAGSCMDPLEHYLQELEKGNVKPKEDAEDPLECLTVELNFFELDRDADPTPKKLAGQKQARKASRELAIKVLPSLMESKEQKIACNAATALALYGEKKAYEPLMACPGDVHKALALGFLGDKRASKWMQEKYEHTEAQYRKKPKLGVPFLLGYLNAIYYLAAPESAPFLDGIIKTSKSPTLKKRAELARKRLR